MTNNKMPYFDNKAIKDLLSQRGLVVGDIELDNDKYIAEVFIEVGIAKFYSPWEIFILATRIRNLETELVGQGVIHNIKVVDLYKGTWRILMQFVNKDDIEGSE